MKSQSFLLLRCFISCIIFTIFLNSSDLLAAEKLDSHGDSGIGTKIEITGFINKDPLGINFKIEDYASAFIEIENKSTENFSIGDDMFIWAEANTRFNVALLMSSQNDIPQNKLSKIVSACGVNNFSQIKTNGILWAFGPGGDWLNLTGLEKAYQGIWPKNVASGNKVTIKHRLATWPGSDQGWLATPIFTAPKGGSFRILAQFGKPYSQQRIVVPLDSKNLQKLISNNKLPDVARICAVYWLESSKSDKK
jgi:hypothetical protein